jgi:hypothetical protein
MIAPWAVCLIMKSILTADLEAKSFRLGAQCPRVAPPCTLCGSAELRMQGNECEEGRMGVHPPGCSLFQGLLEEDGTAARVVVCVWGNGVFLGQPCGLAAWLLLPKVSFRTGYMGPLRPGARPPRIM